MNVESHVSVRLGYRVRRFAVPSVVAMVLGAGLLVVGCAKNVEEKQSAPKGDELGSVSIKDYGDVSAQLDFESGTAVLPLDPYLVNQNQDFSDKVDKAMSSFVESCVVEKGLEYDSGAASVSKVSAPENRLFGPWSVTLAQQFGLGIDPGADLQRQFPEQANQASNDAADACIGEMRTKLQKTLEFFDSSQLDGAISEYAFEAVTSSKEGKDAIARRSECVTSQGVALGEDGFVAESYDSQDAAQQVAAATVFAECQVSTGAIQQLFDLYARYQAAYVDKYEAQLNALVQERQKFEKELDRVIESGA